MPEHPHRCVTGPQTDEASTRCDTIDRRDTIRRHRCETQTRHGIACPAPKALRLLCDQGHHRPDVRANHRAVRHPAKIVTEVLRMDRDPDFINFVAAKSKFYVRPLFCRFQLPQFTIEPNTGMCTRARQRRQKTVDDRDQ